MTDIKRCDMEIVWEKTMMETIGEDGVGSVKEAIERLQAERDSLQEQVQTLAAENCIQDFIISAVRDLARESDGVTGWHLNGDIATWDEVLPELSHSDTPATDAVIREIVAKAVDKMRNVFIDRVEKELGPNDEVHGLIKAANICVAVAASIRAGEQP